MLQSHLVVVRALYANRIRQWHPPKVNFRRKSYLPGSAMSPHARELLYPLSTTQSRAKPCDNCAAAPSPLKAAFLSVSRTRTLSAHSRSSKSLCFRPCFTHISLGATPNEPATVYCPKAASSCAANCDVDRIVVQLTGAHTLD